MHESSFQSGNKDQSVFMNMHFAIEFYLVIWKQNFLIRRLRKWTRRRETQRKKMICPV